MPESSLEKRTRGYSAILTDTFRKKYEAAQRDFEQFDLSHELALARALLEALMVRVEKKKDEGELPIADAVKLLREIRETMKFASEVADRASIPVAMLAVFQQQVIVIIREELKDDEVVQRVARRLGQVALPADRRETEQFTEAVRSGAVPGPDA